VDSARARTGAAGRRVAQRAGRFADLSALNLVEGGDSTPETAAAAEVPAAALASYLRGILRHRLLFASIVLSCVLGSAAWLLHRSPRYEAKATILVTPISATDQTLVGLSLVRSTDQEPNRATETAETLVESPAAAALAARSLHVAPAHVQGHISVKAESDSNIVDVKATEDSPDKAASTANAYARAALRVRSDLVISQARRAIAESEGILATAPAGPSADTLRTRLAALRSVARGGDPTLSLIASASPGTTSDPPAGFVLALALAAGLILAGLTTVLVELLAPRPIEDESELLNAYPLPILARVPTADLGDDLRRPLAEAPGALREGFRALRGQLELRATDRARDIGARGSVVLLVSPGPGDGRVICSLNLARAFVSARESVTLVELDLRHPRMAGILGTDPRRHITGLVAGLPLESVAVQLDGAEGMRLIAAPPAVDLPTVEQVIARSAEIIDESRRLSDWIVVDAPPLSEAADALVAANSADYIVIVVQLGSTSPDALANLRELLQQARRVPEGFLVYSEPAGRPGRMRRSPGFG
jgi:Mrp family chromosome partitioning ATPase/capsular polysaccharide biosynthesis protein